MQAGHGLRTASPLRRDRAGTGRPRVRGGSPATHSRSTQERGACGRTAGGPDGPFRGAGVRSTGCPGSACEPSSRPLGLIVAALAASTAAVGVLETVAGIPNASAVYLVAVVVVAVAAGTAAAVIEAVGAFLLYDVLFVEPLHALAVADPTELLNLAAPAVRRRRRRPAGREPARSSGRSGAREREVRALFAIQRTLASAASAELALPGRACGSWPRRPASCGVAIVLGDGAGHERIATRHGSRAPVPGRRRGRRAPAAGGAAAGRVGARALRATFAPAATGELPHRVAIEAASGSPRGDSGAPRSRQPDRRPRRRRACWPQRPTRSHRRLSATGSRRRRRPRRSRAAATR